MLVQKRDLNADIGVDSVWPILALKLKGFSNIALNQQKNSTTVALKYIRHVNAFKCTCTNWWCHKQMYWKFQHFDGIWNGFC